MSANKKLSNGKKQLNLPPTIVVYLLVSPVDDVLSFVLGDCICISDKPHIPLHPPPLFLPLSSTCGDGFVDVDALRTLSTESTGNALKYAELDPLSDSTRADQATEPDPHSDIQTIGQSQRWKEKQESMDRAETPITMTGGVLGIRQTAKVATPDPCLSRTDR